MKYLFLTFFLVVTQNIFSQNTTYDLYEIEQRNADSLIIINKNSLAQEHLEKAIKYKPHLTPYPYTLIAEIFVKQNKYKKAFFVLRKSIKQTGNDISFFKKNKTLLENLPITYWNKLEKEENTLKGEYYAKYGDIDALVEIEILTEKDQLIRDLEYLKEDFTENEMNNFLKLYPNNKEINKDCIADMHTLQDFRNVLDLIEFAKKHGYQKGMWLLLWHQRGSYGEQNFIWDFFKPFINEEIKKGNVSSNFWCIFDDFYSFKNTGKQIYGEFDQGKVNKDTVNLMRKKVNLPPLTDKQIDEINSREVIIYN